MIRILFICHGNICRSPMAEFVMKDMVERKGLSHLFQIASCATSTEEIGNPVHPGTRRKLAEYSISCEGKRAVQLKKADYDWYDYLIAMDRMNIRNTLRILGDDPKKKLCLLLSFTGAERDVPDPWYTGDFDATYRDVKAGCEALLRNIQQRL